MSVTQEFVTRSAHPTRSAAAARPLIAVVDDDTLMLSALSRTLSPAGFAVETYESGAALLGTASFDRTYCVILDVSMPDMSGIEVQARLKQIAADVPVIFLSGSSDLPIAVTAMREGAVDFIEKPFDRDTLIARVRAVSERRARPRGSEERRAVMRKLESLSPRERSVLELVVAGQTSKQIARSLGGSHRTIEVHRQHLMEKLAAHTLADLVRMRLLAGDELVH